MIVYSLLCAEAHEFEAWFRNSAAFDEQAAAGAIACPICGDTHIRKALMAPAIRPSSKAAVKPVEEAIAAPTPQEADQQAAAMQLLREMRRKIESDCDYVGDNFAEEARKIHYGEVEAHGIYGESTDADREALAEEGIEVGRIPWVPLEN
ncbi:MAG: DUF1178 family protein [Elstera sp.]